MTTLTIYSNPVIKTGFSNAPGGKNIESFLDGVDFSLGQISDTGSIYRSIVKANGHTYSMAMAYSYNSINTITMGLDGQTVVTISNISLPLNDWLLYEGDVLIQKLFVGADSIYCADTNDVIWGYEGNDLLSGGAGNDTFNGGGGYDTIYGGAGVDTVTYSFDRNDYVLSKNPTTKDIEVLFKSGGGGEILKSDVELVQFRDQIVSTNNVNYWGTYTAEKSTAIGSVWRFFNTRDNAFFYTSSLEEKNQIIRNSDQTLEGAVKWPYLFEGTTFEAAHTYSGGISVHRFFNTQTGHHFFTINQAEINYIKSQSAAGLWPFIDEGNRFTVYANDPTAASQGQEIPVYRFYSPQLNRHLFTADANEVANVKATGIWNFEGVAFWGEIPG